MAPECLQGKAISAAPTIDTWSIGIIFYALLYGTLPFYASDEDTTIKLIKTAPLKFDKTIVVSDVSRHIISKLLEREPSKRLELMDLMDMDYCKMEDD